jgi:hypothetical protein
MGAKRILPARKDPPYKGVGDEEMYRHDQAEDVPELRY